LACKTISLRERMYSISKTKSPANLASMRDMTRRAALLASNRSLKLWCLFFKNFSHPSAGGVFFLFKKSNIFKRLPQNRGSWRGSGRKLGLPPFQSLLHRRQDLLFAEGLGDIVKGLMAHGFHRGLHRSVGGDDN